MFSLPWLLAGRKAAEDNLSPHFTLALLTAGRTAAARKIDNTPSANLLPNGRRLAAELEKVMVLFDGMPFLHETDEAGQAAFYRANKPYIELTNAYRCDAYNDAVHGQPNSYHRLFLAADLKPPPGYTVNEMQHKIAADRDIAFDEVLEERTADGKQSWLHFQVAKDGRAPRRKVRDAEVGASGTILRTSAG